MFHSPPGHPDQPFRRARLAAAAMAILLITGVSLQLWAAYEQAIDHAATLTQAMAKTIAERLGGTIRAVDSLLEETAAAKIGGTISSREFQERMLSRLDLFPEVRYIGTVSHLGRLEHQTWPQIDIPEDGLGISDREYFQQLPKAYGPTGLVVGRPTIGRSTGQRSVHVARPITDRDGFFAGAVMASLNPDIFAAFLDTVLLDPEGGAAMIHINGDMVARAPEHALKFGLNIADSDLFTKWLPKAPAATATLRAKTDGNDKLLSYRKLERYPLVVTAGISKRVALAEWRRMAVVEALLVTVWVLAIFYWARRSDRSAQEMAAYGHRLEDAVGRRTQELALARDTAHQQAQRLEKVNSELQRLAMVTAHHLQEPLRPLVSYSQLLEKRLNAADTESADMLTYIRTAAIRLKSLLRDFQRYVSAMTESPRTQWTGSREAADAAADTAVRTTGAGDIAITWGDMPMVWADPQLLRRLFRELLINAIRYHPADSPPRIAVSGVTSPEGWTFSVTDDGPGIPQAMRARVMQVFENVQDRTPESTGLGLPLCRLIAEAHGGNIEITEAPTGGTCVRFFLPAPGDAIPTASKEPSP